MHRHDAIPQYVPRGLYRHIPTEVFYPEGTPVRTRPPQTRLNYIIYEGSGEDPHCQDGVPAAKLHELPYHNFYLNHSMWCCEGATNAAFPSLPRRAEERMNR